MKYDIVFIKEGNGDFLITNGSQWGTNSFPVTELKNVYIFTKEELLTFLNKYADNENFTGMKELTEFLKLGKWE